VHRSAIAILTIAFSCSLLNGQQDSDSYSDESKGIQWGPLLLQSFSFMSITNGFRVATQADTRYTMRGKFFDGYARSLDNLHGWADGDPFFTNYVLHPMEGGLTGFLLVQNDPKFRKVEFGRNRAYWKSRLRATGWAWAYSELFEIGPNSEATVGHTQAYFAQQGFVDHVITPSIGLTWMIAEDATDKYIVRRIEEHTRNPYVKVLARITLNPTRSIANVLRFETPQHRDTRPGVFQHPLPPLLAASNRNAANGVTDGGPPDGSAEVLSLLPDGAAPVLGTARNRELGPRSVPRLEVGINYNYLGLSVGKSGAQSCNGGSGNAVFNLNSWLGVVADVGGCKMMSPGFNISGDSTYYLAGPRFSWRKFESWTPYFQLLGGGNKLTTETMYPDRKPPQAELEELWPWDAHAIYTSADQTNSWALEIGAGVDYKINGALGLRVVQLDDLHTWARDLNNRHYPNNIRVSTGLVLRFGTW
jgi:hypothetical protein